MRMRLVRIGTGYEMGVVSSRLAEPLGPQKCALVFGPSLRPSAGILLLDRLPPEEATVSRAPHTQGLLDNA